MDKSKQRIIRDNTALLNIAEQSGKEGIVLADAQVIAMERQKLHDEVGGETDPSAVTWTHNERNQWPLLAGSRNKPTVSYTHGC